MRTLQEILDNADEIGERVANDDSIVYRDSGLPELRAAVALLDDARVRAVQATERLVRTISEAVNVHRMPWPLVRVSVAPLLEGSQSSIQTQLDMPERILEEISTNISIAAGGVQ